MQITLLADEPELCLGLIPGLLQHWQGVLPEMTWQSRLDRFREHMNRDRLPMAWIAQVNGAAAGTAALRGCDLEGRDELTPWLGGVYVEPAFRRRGVASALCEVVAEKARQMGFERIFLFTSDQQSLYHRLGWRVFDTAVWRGLSSDIMSRSLVTP